MPRPSASTPKHPKISEKAWKSTLLLALSARPNTTVWVQNSGHIKSARGAWVGLMPTGAADIGGVVRVGELGQFIQVETKVAGRKQREEQILWQAMCERRGAIYLLASYDARHDLATNVADALSELDVALARKKLAFVR